AQPIRCGVEAEAAAGDRRGWEAAPFEVVARAVPVFACELVLAEAEGVGEQLCVAVARLGVCEWDGVDAGAGGEFAHGLDEGAAAWGSAAVQVGGPEQRLAAVDEQAGWGGAVG